MCDRTGVVIGHMFGHFLSPGTTPGAHRKHNVIFSLICRTYMYRLNQTLSAVLVSIISELLDRLRLQLRDRRPRQLL